MSEEEIIKNTTKNVFEILKENGFEIKEKKNVFQRTEQLLYLKPKLEKAVNYNKGRIMELEKFGISKGGSAVHIVPTTTPIRQEESEIVEKEINKIKQRNHIINSQIKWINNITTSLANDKYYDLITLKYYQNKTYEEIAEYFQCDVATISRNKTRIINQLKTLLFPNDNLTELGA